MKTIGENNIEKSGWMHIKKILHSYSSRPLLKIAFIFFILFIFAAPWSSAVILHDAFLYGSKWDYATLKFFVSEFFLYLSFFCIVLDWICTEKQKRKKIMTREFTFFLVLLFLYVGVHSFFDGDILIALQQLRFVFAGFLVVAIVQILGCSKKIIAMLWLSALVIPATYGILQFFSQSPLSLTLFGIAAHESATPGTSVVVHPVIGRWVRSYSGFVHPNIFGAYMGSALVLLFFHIQNATKSDSKKIYFFFVSVFITALFVSFSRSAWLGTACFMLGYLFLNRKSGMKKILGVCITGAILLFILNVIFWPLVQVRLFGGEIHETVSITERIDMMEDAQIIFGENKLFGTGIGQYTKELVTIFPNRPGWVYQPVHNSFFLVLIEWGMCGAILLGGGLFYFGKKIYVTNKKELILVMLFLLPGLLVDHFYISMFSGLILIGWYSAYLSAKSTDLTFS